MPDVSTGHRVAPPATVVITLRLVARDGTSVPDMMQHAMRHQHRKRRSTRRYVENGHGVATSKTDMA
eukprot:516840-Rhodomonas_salina.1